ncbi:DUF2092 domain-containing protein [Paucihalobacter ruber]|uniref:DUF2092 domain-containing protein n=1 Tax=Paucihalobacter ruber TaxID=2567861 RepID=A0A506PNT7_9FLAO|nr:DUF2092 domain-containing protein [Paucihalobacter ruber]TPV34877.1 DUF2092 domain-containing protein [Paucihalobacter ruber]
MKKTFLTLSFVFTSFLGFSQDIKDIDSTALFILDKMADVIGDLEAVSFNLSNSIDKLDAQKNIIKHYSTNKILLSGANKLQIRTEGTRGKSSFYYDGFYLSYYNYDENNHITLEAPESTLEMIDQMHLDYDFQFPAADFFYPSFTDDLIEQFTSIKFLGKKSIDGEECYHIMAINKDLNVQLWISDKTYLLPKHFVIINTSKSNLQYESTFSNWSLNPVIPDSAFNFLPPPGSKLISILKKS